MSTKDLLAEIYPAIYENAEAAFPELEFKKTGTGKCHVSTTGGKATLEEGSKGKVYLYENNPSYLIDYTRGPRSVWDYVQERDGLIGNKDVLERLAQLAKFQLPQLQLSEDALNRIAEEKKRAQLWEDVNTFLIDCLSSKQSKHAHTTGAQDIVKYLTTDRGYKATDIRLPGQEVDREHPKMELGYFPSREALWEYLKERGWEDSYYYKEIELDSRIGQSHVLTIALRDHVGRIKGIAARAIAKGVEPKYLYSTGLKKDELLFNLRSVKADKDLVIVEGLLDALIATARGIDNVVALGGTSLNSTQVALAKKYGAKKITLCLDNDKAGAEATARAIEVLEAEVELPVYIATLPQGIKDADELIRKQGAEAFADVIRDAGPEVDYKIERLLKKYAGKEVEGTLPAKELDNLNTDIAHAASKLKSKLDEEYFIHRFLELLGGLGFTKNGYQETIEVLKLQRAKEKQSRATLRLSQEFPELVKELGAERALKEVKERAGKILSQERVLEFRSYLEPTNDKGIKERYKNKPDSLQGGLRIKDVQINYPAGRITIVAGPTGHGKTLFLINEALNTIDINPGKRIYFITYEEEADLIYQYALNTYINKPLSLNNRKSIAGYYSNETLEYIKNEDQGTFIQGLADFENNLIKTGRLNIHYADYYIDELVELIRYLAKHGNAGGIFIDYVQLLRKNTQGKSGYNSRQEEIKQICLDLKSVAIETGLPLILGAQFNRTVVNHLEVLSTNIGEAGDIERVAAQIIGLWNNNFNPKGTEGALQEITRDTKDKASTMYTALLKSRGNPPGLWDTIAYNGNTGKLGVEAKLQRPASPFD